MSQTLKTEAQGINGRAEIKDLIKAGKAFSFIGEKISKAYEGEDGDYYIETIGSSDQEDLVGDVMTDNALAVMQRDFIGKTVFMNHRTSVPDDVFGAIVETKLLKKDGVQLLWFKIVVEKENEAALKTWRVINGGRTQLGMSVTVLVKKAIPNTNGRKNAKIIDDVEPIELSVVGVPCNRESKTLAASASKALDVAVLAESIDANNEPSETSTTNEIAKTAQPPVAAADADATAKTATINETEGEPEMSAETKKAGDNTAAAETTETEAPAIAATDGTDEPGETAAKTATVDSSAAGVAFGARMHAAVAAYKAFIASVDAGEATTAPVVAKGMFNEILAQKPSFWKLCDILNETRWAFASQVYYAKHGGATDFSDIIAAFEESLDEFKAAQVDSFRFWNEIEVELEVEVESVSNALEIEKSFRNLVEVAKSAADEETQGKLRETGATLLELAKSIGVGFESADADTQDAAIAEKSAMVADLTSRLDAAEKTIEAKDQELEVAKAAALVATEALGDALRQPLVAAKRV